MGTVIAVNGSPRKNQNTATLLESALSGAASKGAKTEMVHLYDLNFRGCVSCFACKRVGRTRGVCALRDDLSPLLERLKTADAMIVGTPIYFMGVSASMAAFFERLFFSNTVYSLEIPTVFPRRLASLFIYTMNVPEERFRPFSDRVRSYEGFAERVLGCSPLSLCAFNTYQYSDYSKYEHSIFSEEDKAKWRKEHFPLDCEEARRLASELL